ncbi:hypothetical protein EBR57_07470, partial [bacterium]|nr:hypothetical protein [bacterium]
MTSVFADISDIPFAQLLGLFVTLPGFIWLDSSDVHSSQSHQSYLMAEPIAQFDAQSDNSSFPHFLDRWLPKTPLSSGLVAGYIGYEAPSQWDIPEFSSVHFHKHPTWPQIWLGVYPIVVQIDHITHKITLIVNTGIVGDVRPQWLSRLRAAAPYQTVDPRLTLIVDSTAHDQFIDAVRSTQHHISEGNIYQLNLTRQIQANLTTGNPFDVYLKMRQANPSPFGAYIDTGLIQIMSMSPELFFKVSDGIIETRPIKGTRNRSGSADTAEAMALQNSEKDSAELTM